MIGRIIGDMSLDELQRVVDAPPESWTLAMREDGEGRRDLMGHAMGDNLCRETLVEAFYPHYRSRAYWRRLALLEFRFGANRVIRVIQSRAQRELEDLFVYRRAA